MRLLQIPINTINEKFVLEFLDHNKDTVFNYVEDTLKLLFTSFPDNTDIRHILIKSTTLNKLYSTHVWDVFDLSQKIATLHADTRLEAGDLSIVSDIAKLGKNNRYIYSFATKYCNWHNQNAYPIYDKYVGELLWYYSRTAGIGSIKKYELYDYSRFTSLFMSFIDNFHLNTLPIKTIDKFLWIYGKKCYK